MKNTMRKAYLWMAMLAIVLALGSTFVSCDNGTTSGGNRALNGTWVSRTGERMAMNNGNVTISQNNSDRMRGTYSTGGNNITMTITQLRGSFLSTQGLQMLGLSSSQWYTQQQLRTVMINYLVGQGMSRGEAESYYNSELASTMNNELYSTFSGTYSGNTLTMRISGNYATYTRSGA